MHHRDGPKLTAEHPPVLIKGEAGIPCTEAGVQCGGSRWGLEADKPASYRPGALSSHCRPVVHLDRSSVEGIDDPPSKTRPQRISWVGAVGVMSRGYG